MDKGRCTLESSFARVVTVVGVQTAWGLQRRGRRGWVLLGCPRQGSSQWLPLDGLRRPPVRWSWLPSTALPEGRATCPPATSSAFCLRPVSGQPTVTASDFRWEATLVMLCFESFQMYWVTFQFSKGLMGDFLWLVKGAIIFLPPSELHVSDNCNVCSISGKQCPIAYIDFN